MRLASCVEVARASGGLPGSTAWRLPIFATVWRRRHMPARGARRAAAAQRAPGRHAARSQAPSTEEEVFDVHSVHDSSDEAPPATAKPHAVPPPSEPIDLAASEEDDALGEMDDVELAPSAGPVSYTHLTLPTICSV